MPGEVNQTRRYDASRRRDHAAQARARVLAAGRQMLLEVGYTQTTIVAIAERADVSIDSTYKFFGGKAKLVKAVFDNAFAGNSEDGPDETARRASATEVDPRSRLRVFGDLIAQTGPRVASLALLVRDAAVDDAELAAVWDNLNAERLARMAHHAERLDEDGHLRDDVTVDQARDVLWALASPELFDLFVHRRGWSPQNFGQWASATYISSLLIEG